MNRDVSKLRKILRVLCVLAGAALLVLGCLFAFGYRRFCGLDSRFYQPRADTVIRLVIERSFEMPISFTVLERAGVARLEVFAPPGPGRNEHWGRGRWRNRVLTPAEWVQVRTLVAKTDVRVLASEHQPLFNDGSTWHLSIRTKGGLETVTRHCPDSFPDNERYQALCALALLLDEAADWPILRDDLVAERVVN